MPIPTSRTDLSTNPALNSPSGNDNPIDGDNHLRTAYSFIRQNFDDIVARVSTADLANDTDPLKGAALVANAVARIETVAALRALPAPTRKTVVYVEGYYAAGDGGGGALVWMPASTAADNGGTVFQPNSLPASGRWQRPVDGTILVKQFGVVGDGVTNDKTKLTALFAAMPLTGWTVDFQHLEIYVGAIDAGSGDVFSFTGYSNIRFINPGRMLVDNNFVLSDAVVAWHAMFFFANCDKLDLDVNVKGSAYNNAFPKGIAAVEIQTTQTDTKTKHYRIRSKCENGHAPLEVNRPSSELLVALGGAKISADDFVIDLVGINCEYGLRSNRNGTGVHGTITTDGVVRAYFPVDTIGHNVKVISRNHVKFTDVLIKSYTDNVSDIRVEYSAFGFTAASFAIATLEFENDTENTSMKRIFLKIAADLPDATFTASPIIISNQYTAAGVLKTTTTNSVTDDVFIEFVSGQYYNVDTIQVGAAPSVPGTVHVFGKYANCKQTRGLTFRRGDVLISNAAGDFSAGNNVLYFHVDGLHLEQAAFFEVEIFVDADFSNNASAEAYQKWHGRLTVSTTGAISVSGLTKNTEYLFNAAVAATMAITGAAVNFWLRFAVTSTDGNNALARLHGKLRVFGDSV